MVDGEMVEVRGWEQQSNPSKMAYLEWGLPKSGSNLPFADLLTSIDC